MALFAFGLPSKALLVGLDWSDSVRFDVQAIAPLDTQQPRLRRMVRGLLEQRLKLVSRSDQRTLRYVALVAPEGRTKLKEATTIPALGLRLEGRRGPVDVVVIQSASREPTAN